MKRVVISLIIILFVTMGALGQQETQFVKIEKENIRLAPKGKKVGELLGGTQLQVLERQDNWIKVQFTGWIWSESLTPDATQVTGFAVRASHILVKTQEEAADLLNQLIQGADFVELAKKHSIDRSSGDRGGDLGKFGRGDLLEAFETAIFKLSVGAMSGVVKTDLGYHIIKRTG